MTPKRAGLWLVFAALWIALDVVVPAGHLGSTGGDFRAYHQAARALRLGVSPYSEPAFIYPPLLPVLLLPVASLPLDTARVVWFIASEIALLGALAVMLRAIGAIASTDAAAAGRTSAASATRMAPTSAAALAVGLVWIVGGTVQENLVLGQLNPFLLLLLALALWLASERPRAAGAMIGIAAALKVWPALLLLVLVWRRAWRALAAGVATALALVVVPAAITAILVESPGALGGDRPLRAGTAAPLNVSLPALALRIADPPRGDELPASWVAGTAPGGFEPWARYGWLAAGIAVLVVIGAALALAAPGGAIDGGRGAASRAAPAWREREPEEAEGRPGPSLALDLAAMSAAAILAAPVGWYHYQLCQFPAFALVIAPRLAAGRWRSAGVLLALLAALTRAPAWGFGLYVERFGWTARSPGALWVATSVGPLLATIWAVFLIREARAAGRVRTASASRTPPRSR